MERRGIFAARHLDRASVVVIVLTFALFATACWVRGVTHDAFLEVGVLMVSIKLILNTYYMDAHVERLEARLVEMRGLLEALVSASSGSARTRP